jgi:DNA modification methylase
MVRTLIEIFSKPGDTVLDPFCGSGVVPLEALLLGRKALANDLNPYAYTTTYGKLSAPPEKILASERAEKVLDAVDRLSLNLDARAAPEWVKRFFHPNTFREILAAFTVLREQEDYFLTACLLGILHHVRPGFLSYPASHLTPYLRHKKYPPELYPQMYAYRDLRSRLMAKIERAYRRPLLPRSWENREFKVFQSNAMNLPVDDECVDVIISSPPYFGALDYARDNRLRLWFLGVADWKQLDKSLTANEAVYIPQMTICITEMHRVLKTGGYCVLVLGDVQRNGEYKHTSLVISQLAQESTKGGFQQELLYTDEIPDIRRSRRKTRTTKYERILVLRKC